MIDELLLKAYFECPCQLWAIAGKPPAECLYKGLHFYKYILIEAIHVSLIKNFTNYVI